jgi:hypothetical protein
VDNWHWGYNPKVIEQVLADPLAIETVGQALANFLPSLPKGLLATEWAIVLYCNHAKHRSVAWQGLLRAVLRRLGYPSTAGLQGIPHMVCGHTDPTCCPRRVSRFHQNQAYMLLKPYLDEVMRTRPVWMPAKSKG